MLVSKRLSEFRMSKLRLLAYFCKVMEQGCGKTIGTHSGVFHADDAMGCMLLKEFTNTYRGASVFRSRDSEVLNKLDIVIDVGGVYDHAAARYDHHQKGFNET